MEEMEEAIFYVSKKDPGSITQPREIINFFRTMDVDGNGIIDFNEFLMAMSLESSAGGECL